MNEQINEHEGQCPDLIGDWQGLTIGQVGQRMLSIEQALDELEERKKALNKQLAVGSQIALDTMQEMDLPVDGELKFAEGYKLAIKAHHDCKILDGEQFTRWLFAKGEIGIAKIEFSPAAITRKQKSILLHGGDPNMTVKINPQTRKKWIGDLIYNEKIDELDKTTWPDGLEVTTFTRAEIRKTK